MPERGQPLIALRGVTKHFHLGQTAVRALRGVDLHVAAGEFVVVMGPSGSGKSTLLTLVGGLDRPTEGHVVVDGHDIAGLDEIALASYRRRMVGFVFQSFNLIPTMSARQNVEFPMVFAGAPSAQRGSRAGQLLEAVGLGGRAGHRPTELSGGEQQRVAIARALANRPPIVLGDEPTGNLDSRTGEDVMRILDTLGREGHTLLVVSHDTRVARHAHRVLHMHDGRIVRTEPGGRAADTPRPDAP